MDDNKETFAVPASVTQQAFWMMDQLEPGNPAGNVAVRFLLSGPVDVPLLERSLNAILQRHEILRTRFEEQDGELFQVVLPVLEIRIRVIDLLPVPEAERKAEIDRQGSLEAQKRFDLRRAPLIRASLLHLGPEEHVLQITVHHAVSDGWSIGLITNELAAFYGAFLHGEPSPLEPLPIQFADFSIWQRSDLESPEIAAQRDYWRRKLAGVVELNLPTDRPRPPAKTWRGDIVSILLDVELTQRLQRLCQSWGITLAAAFLTGLKVLLRRYSGQEDIAIGTPIAGRNRTEVENLIGPFINTVILRDDLSGNPPFSQLAKKVAETAIEAYAHQDLPFELMVQGMNVTRDLSRNPLFQINFIHQRDFVRPVRFGPVSLTAVPSKCPGALFDMNVFMVERDGQWRASCEFSLDLYEPETILRVLGHFREILKNAAAHPETPIDDLPLLSATESLRILVDWNQTARNGNEAVTLLHLFAEEVRRNAAKVAVRCADRRLTYAELDRASDRLAARLRSLGMKPGCLVGLFVERSPDLAVALLGILKSGAAYVPMDPVFPPVRLGYMIEDARMPVIVTQSSLLSGLPPHAAQVVLLDELSGEPDSPPSVAPKPEDLAYVIFTSGSTGRPKGVQISHRALANFLISMRREPGMEPQDILLAVTTISFDIAGLELFLPLVTGATVVIAAADMVRDGLLLRRELESTGATMMQATPVTWRMLLEAEWSGNPGLKALCGGEAFPPDLARLLLSRCGSVWNMYGPTETTIWSTTSRVLSGEGPVSIGHPIDNTQVYIVGPGMQPQPVGVPGELLIGGDGVAAGYLGQPDLTAEKFIPDRYDGRPGAKVYRTGDMARWRADGSLDCLGRGDQQIKIRGFRIELGEIEAVLRKAPQVRDAAVVAYEESPGEKRLIAHVVPDGGDLDFPELRVFARQSLPDYMVPSKWVKTEALPLTPNGKVDRRALQALSKGQPSEMTAFIPPETEDEKRLAAIWCELLHVPQVGVRDSFFDLGGHSLLAARMFSRIENTFGRRLPMAALFKEPTICGLLALLSEPKDGPSPWTSLVPINPVQGQGRPPFFCIHGAGGNILLYKELACEIGPEIPFYGLQSQGLDGLSAPLTTVESMAEHYLNEIKAFQPRGPYYLGGYCMGGIVAYELAQRLYAEGESVQLLALFDTYNYAIMLSRRKLADHVSYWGQRLKFHLANIVHAGGRGAIKYVRGKIGQVADEKTGPSKAPRVDPDDSMAVRQDLNASIQSIAATNHRAGLAYRPSPYPGRLTVFKPQRHYSYFPDEKMGWRELANGGLEIVELPLNPHAMLIAPYVRHLAAALRQRLEGAAANGSGPSGPAD